MVLLYYLGTVTLCMGALLTLPAAASPLLGERTLAPVFLIPAVGCISAGWVLRRVSSPGALDHHLALRVSAAAWLLAALIGSIPYLLAVHAGVLDAYFEAMSGFTTTGISVLSPGELPRSVILWRSLTEWVGGMGILVLVTVLFSPATAPRLYLAEARSERLEPSILSTTWKILYIYSILTLAAVLALYLSGDTVFRAVNHALTAVSTGGFSISEGGFAEAPGATRVAVMPFMLAGSTGFVLHRRVMRGEFGRFLSDPEVRGILAATGVLAAFLYLRGLHPLDAAFTSVSAVTTTGFSTLDISTLDEASKYALVLAMLVGGGVGSTAGGLKMLRALAVLKAARWYLRSLCMRRGVPLRLRGRRVEGEEALGILVFVLLYLLVFAAGVLAFVLQGRSTMEAAFMAASAQGNNGLSVLPGYTGMEELIMILQMWLGRLELVPVLALVMRD